MIHNSKKCVLRSLANPNLNGLMIGLKWIQSSRRFVLDERYFPCCEASGAQNIGKDMQPLAQHGIVKRCQLSKRLDMVNAISEIFYQYWPKEETFPHISNSNKGSQILADVANAAKGYQAQAKILHGQLSQPSDIWLTALTCAWRFGLYVHVVNAQAVSSMTLPSNRMIDSPYAIFIEQIDKMWDSLRAQSVGSLIHFAYNSNALVWLELCPQKDSHQKESTTVSDLIKGRISRLKSRSPLTFLDEDCQSRIANMQTQPLDQDLDLRL